jgi:mannose-6-phosphate isomerase-like protein (cupin superfamily)
MTEMVLHAVNLAGKLAQFSDHWSPKIVAEMNDHQFKLVKLQGEFVWHKHDRTDEVFIVLDGSMTVHLHDRDIDVHAGELILVPRGVEHKTSAQQECSALIVEKSGTVNTGDVLTNLTSPADVWI